jgi:ankyrin repeat protein
MAIVSMLVGYGASLSCPPDGSRNALMLAAMFNRNEIVHFLLEHGADPSETDVEGNTALQMAIAMGATQTQNTLKNWTHQS